MMITISREQDRGRGNYGWLKANYSFSFSNYYNPSKMGFKFLRVINEDFIAPNSGFPTHSHKNMEILTIVLKGRLSHKDSLGNVKHLAPGRIQRMYAGSGISHSEFNDSEDDILNLLQIWIDPNVKDIPPEYEEKEFDYEKRGEQILASPNGVQNSIKIHQDLEVSLILLKNNEELILDFLKEKSLYIHVISGRIEIMENELVYGDSIEIQDENSLKLLSLNQETRLLVFKI